MKCDNCGKNEANVKYTQIINGEKKQMFLCEECSKKLGISDIHFNMPISFNSFLEDFFDDMNDVSFMPSLGAGNKELKCSKCGYAVKSYNVSSADGRPYLSCYGRSALHVCDAVYTSINFWDLQEKVGEAIQKELDGLSELYDRIEKENNELEIKADTIRKQIDNIIEISSYSGDALKATAQKLEKKQRELDEIELKIELNKGNACYTNVVIANNVELRDLG